MILIWSLAIFCLPLTLSAAASVSKVSRNEEPVDLRRDGSVTDSMAVEYKAERYHRELDSRFRYGGRDEGGERGMYKDD